MLKLFKLTLGVITALSVSSLCYQLTHGFFINNIYPDHYYPYEAPVSSEANRILNQSFLLFSSGYMTYAFQSADHQYVLKLLKCHHTSLPGWRKLLSNIAPVTSWNYRTLEINQKKAFKDYLSVITAFKEFKDECLIIAINTASRDG